MSYEPRPQRFKGTSELKSAVESAVLYNGTQISGSNGLAMYFPYLKAEEYPEYKGTTNSLGLSDEVYDKFFEEFVSLMTGNDGGGSHPYSGENDDYTVEDIQNEAWYDQQLVGEYEDAYTLEDNFIKYNANEGIEAYYDEIDADTEVEVNFYITDIYQNEYWTEPITYSPD